jgi:acyl-CoA synthetase (AMP-forming)/AMP-acid ligase II
MMVPILDLLAICSKYNTRTALMIDGRTVTYADLHAAVTLQRDRLAAMLQPGDRLALLCSNSLAFITVSLAAEAAGLIRVPLNIKSTAIEVAALLEDCGPALVVFEEEMRALLSESGSVNALPVEALCGPKSSDGIDQGLRAAPAAGDRCSITYTSGSTGKPKGVVLSHANWHHVFINMLIDRDIAASDTLAFIGPLTHAGWSYLYAGLLRGARAAIFAAGDVDSMLSFAAKDDVTIITCVPTSLSRIVTRIAPDHRLRHSLKWIGVGGAPTSPALLERSMAVFGRRIVLNFGQTEAMMTCAFYDFAREPDREDAAGFIGRPYLFSDVVIMAKDGSPTRPGEIGEICVRGPHTMLEYWNAPELTAQASRDGYILTGDLGVEVEPGLFRIVGRAKEIIISGGFNIYPIEVETAVAALDGIDEVAVIGAPCEEWGEKVVCFFSTHGGARLPPETLREVLKPRLGIKTPKVFHQMPALPKAATGKIDKKALRQHLEAMQ